MWWGEGWLYRIEEGEVFAPWWAVAVFVVGFFAGLNWFATVVS